MKLSTIEEAIAAELDEPVLAIRGTMTKLYSQMSGEGQYGPWTIQNGQLQDNTGEIKVVFSNAPSLDEKKYRNQLVEFRCTKGTKGGWSGVKRTVDKKTKVDVLQISDKAEIILFDAEHEPEPNGAEQKKPAQSAPANEPAKASGSPQGASQPQNKVNTPPPQEKPPQAAPAKPQQSVDDLMADGIGKLTQLANCQYAALRLVREYLMPLLQTRGIQCDPIQESTLVQNMLIQCYRENIHWKFPQKQFTGKKPAAAAPAAPPAQGPATQEEPPDDLVYGGEKPF